MRVNGHLACVGIVYYNGWIGPDRAHGHSLYTQNKDGMKIIRDNIMFKQYMYGIQAYGSGASFVDNYLFEGNVLFRNGVDGQAYGLLLGIGVKPVHNIAINTNFFYNANAVAGSFGYYYGNSPNEDLAMKGNYVVGTSRFYRWKKLDAAENTIVGPIEENTIPEAPAMVDRTRNTVLAEPPTGVAVFVRPNQYEPGRAHVIIYNWDRSDAVRVDLSEVLKADAAYEVRDAQNLYGAPVTGGTNDGKPISIPMKGLTVAKPIGKDAPAMPPHTAPEFGVFVVMEAP